MQNPFQNNLPMISVVDSADLDLSFKADTARGEILEDYAFGVQIADAL